MPNSIDDPSVVARDETRPDLLNPLANDSYIRESTSVRIHDSAAPQKNLGLRLSS
jgi:hypothetical protein